MIRKPNGRYRTAGGSQIARHAGGVARFGYPQRARSHRHGRTTVAASAAAVLALALTACGDDDDGGSGGSTELTVLAASSLTNAFDELEGTYEDQQPDVDVKLSYDSSSILAEQVVSGAPADVLATADTITMQSVVDAGDVEGEPEVFVQNTLVIVTPPDNPAGIQDVTDLPDAAVAVCVPEAPCGNASKELMGLNDIDLQPATEEDNVSSVLTKVTSGEVDAGLVYVTDAQAAGDDVQTIQIPHSGEVINDYPIAVIADSENSEAAQAWVDLVLSQQGQGVLAEYGFRTVS
jgi:molybdate transport system substrate-binding protein